MTAFLFDEKASGVLAPFERVSLSATTGHSERWLQERLYELPQLLPMTEMFGYGESFVPLCRELRLRYSASNVFLDLLGVSASGRLVLVECKLWRNPEARREVVAQLFEYATILAGLTYSDLEAQLKKSRGLTGENPIFAAAKAVHPDLEEAPFVDAVNQSLTGGDFLLAIAGDGIRSDLHALRRLLASQGGLLSRLAFVEIRTFRDDAGRTLLIPAVSVQTELVRREVLVRGDGSAVERLPQLGPVRADEAGGRADSTSSSRNENRAFWDRFIAQATFDHPDQPPPRHGGNNWVQLALPGPVVGLTAYRALPTTAGFSVTFKGARGREALQTLLDDQAALEQEIGEPVRFDIAADADPKAGTMVVDFKPPEESVQHDEAQMAWLLRTANALVNTLRPRFASFES
ncbi:hypothetical protein [Caballeronia sp. Lep1P3]|uniref:hypothetical protein n=1 Tax=Burkholderiaceae TaxID=119060 RepID=UPI001FD38AD7|nr:hypothetical protein [Caballeronia sp. Lep1P3]